jgi:hypothetical protein
MTISRIAVLCLLVLILLLPFFVPSIYAFLKRKKNRKRMLAVQLLLLFGAVHEGWSLTGPFQIAMWVLCLIWCAVDWRPSWWGKEMIQ